MKMLAIETSSQACSVALCIDKKITQKHHLLNNQHSQFLLPYIDDLLTESSIKKAQLDMIAVGNGPGSFTGLRLGMGVAQGFSYGLGKPLVAVSSLLTVAAQSTHTHLLVAVDARMGEVYWQCFEQQNELNFTALTSPSLNKPAELVLPHIDGRWHGIGSGWDVYSDQLMDNSHDVAGYMPDILPQASVVGRIAQKLIEQGSVDPAQKVLPVYVRNRVAG